jgi:hypothetical protein
MKKKIMALIISLMFMPGLSVAQDGPYLGVKYDKINIDYKTVDGIDLNQIFGNKFDAYDFHAGYNLGNGFFEIGYIKSSDEQKYLGSTSFRTSSGTATISASTGMKFDGYRLGAGYNYAVNKQFTIKPFINYYELNFTESGVITVSLGSTSVRIGGSLSGKDNLIDGGIGFDYLINENTKLGLSYARSIDSVQDTNKIQTVAINASYKF